MRFRRLRFHISIIAGVMGIVAIMAFSLIVMILSVADRSGAYLRYAEKFFKPSQIDEVDIGNYL